MKGPAHGALVAGVSSGVVAAWTRNKTRERYDPTIEPPSYSERIKDQLPTIAKGIGFTGLTWLVARCFDKVEATVLADSYTGLSADISTKTHHNLHSLPYFGPFFTAARLIKQNSSGFGEWLGEKLNIPEFSDSISKNLNEFADWVLNYPSLGAVGHILGDVPTSGQGGTALKLLKPIVNSNFALGLVKSSSKPLNEYLFAIGGILTAASWAVTATYSISWKPPEMKIKDYVNKLRECESVKEAVIMVLEDIEKRLGKIFNLGKKSLFDLPAFKTPAEDIHNNPFQGWFNLNIPAEIFGLSSFSKDSLREDGFLPRDFTSRIETSSLYEREQIWPTVSEVPLVVSGETTSEDTKSLFQIGSEGEYSYLIKHEEQVHYTRSLYDDKKSENEQDSFTSNI